MLFIITNRLTHEAHWTTGDPTWTGYRPVIGDFDGDHKADLLWLGQLDDYGRCTGSGCIFTRTGSDLSVHTPINCNDTTWTGYTFETGDFDGDQRTDLLGIGRVDTSLRYTGAGCLFTRYGGLGMPHQVPWTCDATWWSNYIFMTGDFDGDRRTDVAGIGTVNPSGLYSGAGALFVRTGGVSLPNERDWSVSSPPWTGYSATAADRNGDGITDLAWEGALDDSRRYTGMGVLFDRE